MGGRDVVADLKYIKRIQGTDIPGALVITSALQHYYTPTQHYYTPTEQHYYTPTEQHYYTPTAALLHANCSTTTRQLQSVPIQY